MGEYASCHQKKNVVIGVGCNIYPYSTTILLDDFFY
jgi:hypothetical protein